MERARSVDALRYRLAVTRQRPPFGMRMCSLLARAALDADHAFEPTCLAFGPIIFDWQPALCAQSFLLEGALVSGLLREFAVFFVLRAAWALEAFQGGFIHDLGSCRGR